MRRRSRPDPLPFDHAARKPLTHCPYHEGVSLAADGYCPVAGGYPLGVLRAESCPYCRAALEWDGGCLRCHGCGTGERRDWTFPGSRFDRFDDQGQPIGDGQHWVLTDATTDRAAVSPEDASTRMAAIQRILAGSAMKGWKK